MRACRSRTSSNAGPTSRSFSTTTFIPTVLQRAAATGWRPSRRELLGLLHQRGEALAGRVAATGRGGAAEFADFLMLQAINRYEPLLAHYADAGRRAPRERCSDVCVSAAGELATFTTTSKRPPKLPAYRHDRLRESFDPVIAALRESLSKVLDAERHFHSRSSRRNTASASRSSPTGRCTARAVFILAARADVPAEELRRRFPAQLKIGPVEKIGDLVRLQLPGVPVHAVPVAPATDSVSRRASRTSSSIKRDELWEQLKSSGGVAMHVAGEFPGLAMEFWAIRS